MEKLVVTIFPHPPKRKELLSACRMIASRTLEEVGCMDSRVFSDSSEDSAVRLEQYWRNKDLLEDYFRSDHFSALLGAMKLLGKNYEVTINECALKEGINAVENARTT